MELHFGKKFEFLKWPKNLIFTYESLLHLGAKVFSPLGFLVLKPKISHLCFWSLYLKYTFFFWAVSKLRIETQKTQVSSIFIQRPLWERNSKFCKFFPLISLLLKIICKTLSNCPTEVSGWKCLKLGFSEFLSLLYLLPLRKRCTLTTDFRNIGMKSWVLVLKTLGVKTLSHLSVHSRAFLLLFVSKSAPYHQLQYFTLSFWNLQGHR